MRNLHTLAVGAILVLGWFTTALVQGSEPEYAAALDKRISVELSETPFVEAVAQLAQELGVRIQLDPEVFQWGRFRGDQPQWRKANELSLRDERAPVWLKVDDISIISALQLLLGQFDLVYQLREDHLEITSRENAGNSLTTKAYSLAELTEGQDRTPQDYAAAVYKEQYLEVARLLTVLAPDSWDKYGGLGSYTQIGAALVISQTDHEHRQIEALLSALRQVRNQNVAVGGTRHLQTKPISLATFSPLASRSELLENHERAITVRLGLRIDKLDLIRSPLGEAVDYLAEKIGVLLFLDRKSLAAHEISAMSPVSISIADVTAAEALRAMLEPLDLAHFVHNDMVIIAPADFWHEYIPTVVYPVGDLIPKSPLPGDTNSEDLIIALEGIEPNSWSIRGGKGEILYFEPTQCLVVRQRLEIQSQIIKLLEEIRQATEKVSPDQQAARVEAWESELVWQGFRWEDSLKAYRSNEWIDRLFTNQVPAERPPEEPPSPMSLEEQIVLKQVLDRAMPAIDDDTQPIILTREREILVCLPRAAMRELERKLSAAPLETTKPKHWQPYSPHANYGFPHPIVPIVH